ncbi:MAG: exodeoxyribonuclease V subunit alpha [Burkholderiaceae bacterium]
MSTDKFADSIGQEHSRPGQGTSDQAAMQLSLGFPEALQTSGPRLDLHKASAVLELLEHWHEAGWLQQLDLRFARFLHAEQADASGLLLLAAALASHQLGRGHVCLNLAATLSGPGRTLNLPPEYRRPDLEENVITPAELLGGLSLRDWELALHPAVVSDGNRVTPLVYDSGRLYLYRYWRYEQQVAQGLAARVQEQLSNDELPVARVHAILEALFGPSSGKEAPPDWQRFACALAARQRFSIITGGPGTGKTTTVIRLLALLQALHFERHAADASSQPGGWRPLRIQLAAPTGKAAARLGESIAGKVSELPVHQLPGGLALAAAIPVHVVTLHRLLGGRPHTQARRYNADNPLALDVLVVDEASMVSLADMAHLVAALPPHAQLILIGDKDQLSSVEAGAVLGELCSRAEKGHYLPATVEWLEAATGMAMPPAMQDDEGKGLDQAVAMLRVSHRFDEDSGIGRLAFAVNEGKSGQALALLADPPADLAHVRVGGIGVAAFARLVVHGTASTTSSQPGDSRQGYAYYLDIVSKKPASDSLADFDAWALEVLRAQRACQLLCVLRKGSWGVEGLNPLVATVLHRQGLIPAVSGWYAGRPVMVTRNNPALRLTNGDIGVVLEYPVGRAGERVLRVAFPDGDGAGVRWFAPNRLDDVETVYALTVHKSQGSEFRHAMLALPPALSPVLTRELIYTGITRASHWFTLVNPAGDGMLRQAIGQRVQRSGGLGDVLDAFR